AAVQDLVPIIRPLIPPTSHFAPHNPSNSVILTDTTANIQRVLKIVRRLDVPDTRADVHVVYLEKAKASELATTLTQLITSTATNRETTSGSKVTIQPLDAINALVISASGGEFVRIQALIEELDIERELVSDVNVIYLKHAKAEDLVSILNDITASNTQGAVSEFSVQADEATNSLIVKASGSQLRVAQGVIEMLDVRRAQVFVETVIAEVSLDQEASLGIDWSIGSLPTETTVTTNDDGSTSTTTTGGGNLFDEDNRLTSIGSAQLAFTNGGIQFDLLDFKKYDFDVVVNAIKADSNSNILSTPTILTLDNEEAEIVVGQEVPFVTGRFNNGLNNSTNVDANGNATSVNVGSSFQTIERKDVGIKLKIKPQISEGDTIQLEVLQEISSVAAATVQGQADLITNRRSIEAVVQVDDGQVVVLGGLIQDDVIDTVSWVPVLGKIPVIGNLFRNTSKEAVKRNLMVFLKPRIIRDADSLAKYSKVKYDEVRRDGQLSRLQSSEFLIEDSDPPVLDAYEDVVGDGVLQSERRKDIAENNDVDYPKRRLTDVLIPDLDEIPLPWNPRPPKDDPVKENAIDPSAAQELEEPENKVITIEPLSSDGADLSDEELEARVKAEMQDARNQVTWDTELQEQQPVITIPASPE
ncbi:MAG: secretin N-terminal domain-containing protein, partial [Pseudomonadota bacterium]